VWNYPEVGQKTEFDETGAGTALRKTTLPRTGFWPGMISVFSVVTSMELQEKLWA